MTASKGSWMLSRWGLVYTLGGNRVGIPCQLSNVGQIIWGTCTNSNFWTEWLKLELARIGLRKLAWADWFEQAMRTPPPTWFIRLVINDIRPSNLSFLYISHPYKWKLLFWFYVLLLGGWGRLAHFPYFIQPWVKRLLDNSCEGLQNGRI